MLNVHQGDRLGFQMAADGTCVVRKMTLRKSDGAARSYLKAGCAPLSEELIQDAIKKGALASYRSRNQ